MQNILYYWGKFVQLYLTPKILNNCQIDKKAKVCSGAILNYVKINKYSYVGHNSSINDCDIGSYCSIAGGCIIGGSSHPVEWVSTSPVFHTKRNVLKKSFCKKTIKLRKKTTIGNDVWIGANVLIKSGVTIGDGVVIGMGSVVTKDIPAYEIWGGNPAHKIRDRFSNDLKNGLFKSKWWEYDDISIGRLAPFIDNPDKFILESKIFEDDELY